MKKITLKVTVCLLIGSLTMNSCIGSFALFNKYAAWQKDMTNSKFVNAIVGFFLMPVVGGITLTVDWLILNTIEFWSGDNPVASRIGTTEQVLGQDGRYYAVTTLKNGYEIKAPDGQLTLLTYDKQQRAWLISQNGATQELFRFNADGQSIRVANVNGESQDFTLNEQGVYEARMASGHGQFFALR